MMQRGFPLKEHDHAVASARSGRIIRRVPYDNDESICFAVLGMAADSHCLLAIGNHDEPLY